MVIHQLTANNINKIRAKVYPGDTINISEPMDVVDINRLSGRPDAVITVTAQAAITVGRLMCLDSQYIDIDGAKALTVMSTAEFLSDSEGISNKQIPLIQTSGSHIAVSQCLVQSFADSSTWDNPREDADVPRVVNDGIILRSKDSHAFDNIVRNVRRGVQLLGLRCIAKQNHISHFSEDGLRPIMHGCQAIGNQIRHAHFSGEHVHNDGIQMWLFGAKTPQQGRLENIVIKDNLIFQNPERTYLQGIGCFDGVLSKATITGNHVMTNHDHAISIASANGCTITGNTAVNSISGKTSWILLGTRKPHHPPCRNNVVEDNLAQRMVMDETACTELAGNVAPTAEEWQQLDYAMRTGDMSVIS